MSLVNEALKRARAEAEEREAKRSATPLPSATPVAHSPAQGARWLPILGLLGIVFLVGLVAGAITFVRNRAAIPPQVAAQPSEATRGVGNSTPPIAPTETAPEPAPPAHRATPKAAPPAELPAEPRPTSATTPPATTPTAAPPTRTVAAPSTPSKAPTAQSAPREPVDATVAGVREATALDGRSLALGGIAWSDSGPFALVNGRVLAKGERIEGFQVVEIEREWVRLEDGSEQIVLKLR